MGGPSQQERASRRTPASERLLVWMLPSGLLQGGAVGHQRARTDQEENRERGEHNSRLSAQTNVFFCLHALSLWVVLDTPALGFLLFTAMTWIS